MSAVLQILPTINKQEILSKIMKNNEYTKIYYPQWVIYNEWFYFILFDVITLFNEMHFNS